MLKKLVAILIILLNCQVIVNARAAESIMNNDNCFLEIKDVDIEQGLIIFKDLIGSNDAGILPFRIGWGVMNNMEVGVKIPYVFIENGDNEFGDISIYQKFKFIEEKDKLPVLCGGLEFNLPTGNIQGLNEYGNSKLDFKLFGTIGKKVSPKVNVFGGLSVNFIGAGDATEFGYNSGINYIVSTRCKLTGEFYGKEISSESKVNIASQSYISPGIIFNGNNNITVKFAIPFGLNNKSADHIINISLIHTF